MIKLVFTDIFNTAIEYLPISILVGISISILSNNLLVYLQGNSRCKATINVDYYWNRFILMSFFFTYCFMVICLTLLSRDPGSRFEVRLETFRIFSSFDMDRTYAIENIIMFVPLGFMLPFLNRKFHSFKIIIFIGFIGSFAIEVSQYITKRGFTELDDILNNVVGIIIGYVIFSLAKVLHSYKQETL